jgi:hypothetical protein
MAVFQLFSMTSYDYGWRSLLQAEHQYFSNLAHKNSCARELNIKWFGKFVMVCSLNRSTSLQMMIFAGRGIHILGLSIPPIS